MKRSFPIDDERHLQAAVGWLELGDWHEANEELENISPRNRAHADVLKIRVKIYFAAQKWGAAIVVCETLGKLTPDSSFGPLHQAHALRHLNRIEDARQLLLPFAGKFSCDWQFCYALACFSCKTGNRSEGLRWLELSFDYTTDAGLRLRALNEPDLETLWVDIADL